MYCRHCGLMLPPDSRFCSKCGKPVELPKEPLPPKASEAPPAEPTMAPEPPQAAASPEPNESPGPAAEAMEAQKEAASSEPEPSPPVPNEHPVWHEPEPPPRKKSKLPLVLGFFLVLLLAVGGAIYYFFFLDGLFPQREKEGAGESSSVAPAVDEASGSTSSPSQSEEASELEEPAAEPDPSKIPDQWPEFAHISNYYHNAQETDGSIYFLPGEGTGLPPQLYRMEATGENLEIILDPGFGENGEILAIKTFAVLGDYIYFSSTASDALAGYYRAPTAGGAAEFLFLEAQSYLVPYENKLYFLFPQHGAYGVYVPDSGIPLQIIPIDPQLPDSTPSQLLPWFSVAGGQLYYGLQADAAFHYYRMDLAAMEHEELISANDLGNHILQPIWANGALFYLQRDSSLESCTWNRLLPGEEPEVLHTQKAGAETAPFAARMGNFFLFQDGERYLWCTPEEPSVSSVMATSGAQPFAVTQQFIFFPAEAFSTGSRADPISLNGVPNNNIVDFPEAYSQALEVLKSLPESEEPQPESSTQP